jgi:hypothetical protein
VVGGVRPIVCLGVSFPGVVGPRILRHPQSGSAVTLHVRGS